MEPLPAARTTAYRLRHAPMGFARPVTPTRVTAAPPAPEKKIVVALDHPPSATPAPREDSALWPSLALS